MSSARKRMRKTVSNTSASNSSALILNELENNRVEEEQVSAEGDSISTDLAVLRGLTEELKELMSGDNAEKAIEIAALLKVLEDSTRDLFEQNKDQEIRITVREKTEAELIKENEAIAAVIQSVTNRR